ncbi:unnamed protein product, partial [Porites lobata]
MARNDMDHLILRPGELHIVMAQLRTIGSYIDNTLFSMYQDAFFQFDGECYQAISQAAKELDEACTQGKKEEIVDKNTRMMDTISSLNVLEKMTAFDEARDKRPIFKVIRPYMHMVTEMLTFIRAVRTGDWELHLQTLAKFSRYFFAHDMINYARMIPIYLAEMESLNESDPDIVEEFQQGNWVVNKNSDTSFCELGADHALEHINRSMKVSGGLIGITLNPSARNKFFLIAPELARLAEEAKNMAGLSRQKKAKEHHNLSTAVLVREERNVKKLTATIERFTNPFTEESDDLFYWVTKVVVAEKVKDDLCGQSKQAQLERLPPTHGALREAILRAHYQTMVWNNDKVPNPNIPSPENYGWKKDNDEWLPVMTTTPPAPEAIIEMVKCGCVKQRCSTNRCQCRKAGLTCTELCACSDDDEPCENSLQEDDSDEYIDDNDESDNS